MKFLADESVDKPIVDYLRQNIYQVLYIAEMEPGITDNIVLKLANDNKAILLSCDKDFGELVFRQKLINYGVVLIRLSGLSPISKAEVVLSAISKYISELLNSFTVIMPGTIRIRNYGRKEDYIENR